MPLESDDQQHIRAPEGYCELGMLDEAMIELEEIEPNVRHLPEILAVRVMILQGLKKMGADAGGREKIGGMEFR